MENPLRVLITGSSRGIGREIARRFAQSGAHVALHGRNEERLSRTLSEFHEVGLRVVAVVGDISEPASAKRIVADASERLGGLDVVINNAGMVMRGRFEDTSPDVWRAVVGANLLGAAYVTGASLPLVSQRGGSIVFISSIVGLWGFPRVSAYSASKMALNGFVESVRAETAKSGVHIGVVYVGVTQNDPDKTILAADGSSLSLAPRPGAMTQEQVANAVYRVVLRRRRTTVLTVGGKLIALLSRVAPGAIRLGIRLASRRIDRMSE